MMLTQALRYSGDSRGRQWLAWRFIVRNLFQVVATLFFGAVFILGALEVRGVAYTPWTVSAFGAACLSYTLLLVAPARRWVRAYSVAAPLVAIGLRLNDVLMDSPVQPTAVAVWGLLAFIFYRTAPDLLPPPLSNGERRRWLDEGGK